MTETVNTLGEYVESVRIERGYSLRELGKLSGIPHPTIKRIENGVIAVPGPAALLALIDALQLNALEVVARIAPYQQLCQRIIEHYQTQQEKEIDK